MDKRNDDDLFAAWRRHMEAGGTRPDRKGDGSDDWGDWGDWFGEESGAQKAKMAAMQEQMDVMAKVINRLLDRVNVLERLAVADEKMLAAEIEKLRGAGRRD